MLENDRPKLTWCFHGVISLCNKGWPKFPHLPSVPGLYRLTLNDRRSYIGEAANLKRRLYEYRRPTQGIVQEYRVHAALVAAGGGKLDIYIEGDLSSKAVRTKLEKAEIAAALKAGMLMLNNEGPETGERLKARIKFLEAELAAASAALENLNS